MTTPFCGVANVAQDDRMIACGMDGMGVAMKTRQHTGKGRCTVRPGVPVKVRKIMALAREMQGKRVLIVRQNVDAKVFGIGKHVVPFGPQGSGPQHQWRVQGHRGK